MPSVVRRPSSRPASRSTSPLARDVTESTSLLSATEAARDHGTSSPPGTSHLNSDDLPKAGLVEGGEEDLEQGEGGHPPSYVRKRRVAPPQSRLRSRLLFILISTLLGVCIYASFVEDFMGVVEASISCGTCLGLLVPLQALAHVGDDAFVDFFVGFCTKLGIEDADVCLGAVGSQAPILAHDLRSISLASHAAKNFCSTVFGLCPLQEVIPYSVDFKPTALPPNATVNAAQRGGRKPPFQVVHLSDVHIDREYVIGSNTVCSKVICCRDYGLGSLGPNISSPAGKFGSPKCDAPVALVHSMFRAIERVVPQRAFSIFTGDIVEAAVWAVDQPGVTRDLHDWYAEMQAPSYPSIGNHDVAPVNSFPRSTSPSAGASQWVFEEAAKDWEKWIGPKAAEQVLTMSGCYARVHPGTNLKIISLNTQYWYKQNFWLYDSDEPQWDPNGILSWMAHELHTAERDGQRAWIIGHMPFGKVDCMRDQSNYANQIFLRYEKTIAAQFYGHSHVDEFEISYSDYNNRNADTANGIAFISGALTPASGNPVFRVYDIDPDTYEVMDFKPFYANVSEPSFQVDPVWKPYYSARESYGSMIQPPLQPEDSLNGSFWHRVTEVFERNDTAFQLYNTRLTRGGKPVRCRRAECKSNTICMLRSQRAQDNCVVVQPGFSFKDKKREPDILDGDDEEPYSASYHADTPPCEGPGLGTVLRHVAKSIRRGPILEPVNAFATSLHSTVRHHHALRGNLTF